MAADMPLGGMIARIDISAAFSGGRSPCGAEFRVAA